MDGVEFLAYSSFVLVVFVLISFLEVVMQFLLENWDVVSLIVTNILALFAKRPQDWRKK